MNCENLSFSQELSQNRINQARGILGTKVVNKIIAYALFLLGINRTKISYFIGMPQGSIRSLIRTINNRGLTALEDQRCKRSSFKPPANIEITPSVRMDDSCIYVDFGLNNFVICLPDSNPIQRKIVLLTLLYNGILKSSQVAQALNLSVDRTLKLSKKLRQQDIEGIVDKRQGQQKDYRFTPEIKAEVIQQFVLDIVQQGHTSGEQLSENIKNRTQLELSPRTILHHLAKLGLSHIKTSLPILLGALKKNSKNIEK
jgi:DNA-binding transcriptional ArsR family regulator